MNKLILFLSGLLIGGQLYADDSFPFSAQYCVQRRLVTLNCRTQEQLVGELSMALNEKTIDRATKIQLISTVNELRSKKFSHYKYLQGHTEKSALVTKETISMPQNSTSLAAYKKILPIIAFALTAEIILNYYGKKTVLGNLFTHLLVK